MQTKAELRSRVLRERDALPEDVRRQQCAAISERLVALPCFTTATTVMAYMSFGSEFDTGALLRAVFDQDKILVLAKINRATRMLDLFNVRQLEHDLAPSSCPAWRSTARETGSATAAAITIDCLQRSQPNRNWSRPRSRSK
jgi:5-formyltetrahydrofolate cyclo-ligase